MFSSPGRSKQPWRGPPRPPPPELVAKDMSCQGILGSTLRQALSDLQAKKFHPGTTAADREDGTGGNSEIDDESEHFHPRQDIPRKQIMITNDFKQNVLHAFGTAMAQTQNELYQAAKTDPDNKKRKRGICFPPKICLQGNMESYNRHSGKWRIAVKNAKILKYPRRGKLSKQEQLLRQTQHPADQTIHTTVADGSETTISKLEVLAYNDTK